MVEVSNQMMELFGGNLRVAETFSITTQTISQKQ